MIEVRERDIERYLGRKLKEIGCLYLKFVSPGNVGVPDRIVVTPNGHVAFVELKRDGGKLSVPQELMIRRLRGNKADVSVIFGMTGAALFIGYVQEITRGGDGG